MAPKTVSGSLVRHLETDTLLDLREPEDLAILEELRDKGCHRNPPTLVCEDHRSPVYLQRRARAGTYHLWAITFDGSHSHKGTPSVMSEEHKRQTEYIVRAAQRVGWRVGTEVTLSTRTRPDAVIYGPEHSIPAEIQRSALTRGAAVNRTDKAMAAGLDPSVWFSDRGMDSLPKWMHAVPSVAMNWVWGKETPPPGTAPVTSGVVELFPARCDVFNFEKCPKKPRNWCGEWHVKQRPWLGLTVDSVAEMAPAGEIIPLHYLSRYVYLVSKKSAEIYQQVTGHTGHLILRPRAVMRPVGDVDEDRSETCWVIHGEQLELPYDYAPRIPTLGACIHWRGDGYCGALPARLFRVGYLCPAHAPAQTTPPPGTTLADLMGRR